jgi:hypothetical protein
VYPLRINEPLWFSLRTPHTLAGRHEGSRAVHHNYNQSPHSERSLRSEESVFDRSLNLCSRRLRECQLCSIRRGMNLPIAVAHAFGAAPSEVGVSSQSQGRPLAVMSEKS